MLDYRAIGSRIKTHRKKAGLSQEALAEKVWISTTHMSHIETGSTKLSLPVLASLAKALNVSTDEILFGGVDSPKAYDAEIQRIMHNCSYEQLKGICELIKLFTNQL